MLSDHNTKTLRLLLRSVLKVHEWVNGGGGVERKNQEYSGLNFCVRFELLGAAEGVAVLAVEADSSAGREEVDAC